MRYTEATRGSYARSWAAAEIRPDRLAATRGIVDKLTLVRPAYQAVADVIGCPWWMVAAIHQRESSGNFSRHLHNGDPLTARTRQVPAGRPIAGAPPFTWPASALDALRLKGLDKVPSWEIERVLFECERYNGWGYLGKTNSPYLWSFTTLYSRGKYVADHVWSASAVDAQCGVAAMFKLFLAAEVATPAVPIGTDLFPPAPAAPVPLPASKPSGGFWNWIMGFWK